jgi:hypothetical protein
MNTGGTADSVSWAVVTSGLGVPLRWSSGGALTVVTWRGKQWVAVFFRDIQPIGWNVANGASESSDQWRDMSPLSDREAGEELMPLSDKPIPRSGVLQYQLEDKYEGSQLNHDQHFGKAHVRLRKQQDDIDITLCGENPISTMHALTPFSYEVRNGEDSFKKGNFVFSLNPLECGIEVIRILKLQLPDNCWLSDGEIWPHPDAPGAFLLRRPVVLLDVVWLFEQFRADRSFGEAIVPQCEEEEDFVDCKRLRGAAEGRFHPFIDLNVADASGRYDIDLRRARQRKIETEWLRSACSDVALEVPRGTDRRAHLESIQSHLRERFSGEQLQVLAGLAKEWHQIDDWMQCWGALFRTALSEGCLPEGPLTTLCPVTWKTLELAFQFGLLQ